MAETKNTISDVLSRLTVDIGNMNEFLYSLQNILESKSENVTVKQTLDNGEIVEINVPSFGYMKGKIDDVSSSFSTLVSANNDVIGIKSANGDVRKFELKKVSKIIQELEDIKNTSITVPTSFGIKNNWFFESFLNPLLFVTADLTSVLTDDIDQFSVKRIIINSIDDDELAFFDDNYLGNNEINLDVLKQNLEGEGIDFFEDDNIMSIDIAVNRFKGSFDVLKILEEEVDQTLEATDEIVTTIRRRYKLSTLNYTDVLDDVDNTRILAEGNTLITDNDSEYRVVSVNKTDTEIVLERIFGIEPITIGANILMIKPERYRAPELQINVGFNERQAIFIRPISKSSNLTVDDYSNGFGVFTNDLTITLEDDSESTLDEYYNNFVSDFGLILLNAAKEKKLPAILAEEPDSPVIDAVNFEVTQVDKHIKEDEDDEEIRNQIAEKENLKVRISENLKKLDELKANLNDSQKTSSERNRISKKISSTVEEKVTLQSQLSSVVSELSTKLSSTPAFNRTPKYRVRGFWPMPEGKNSQYGTQEVAQFRYRWRYLSGKGTAPDATQSKIAQSDNSTTFAAFSPWNEALTKPRGRELDESTGLYKWSIEDVSNAEVINSNQLDISIRKGETVEIQIRSISEAGFPDNPVESEWSVSVSIPFPEDLASAEEATIISQKIFAEEARLDFEDELTSRGLDLHLANQFTTGERFFSHQAKDVASGFFTTEGNIIDLFEKIKSLETALEAVQLQLTLDKGVIKISIVDSEGNTSEISNGDNLTLFAGYYKDQIKDTSGASVVYNEGKVITKQYVLSIENTSATPLELISLLQGGIEQPVLESDPVANPMEDYHINKRYDLVPLSINTNTDGVKGGYSHIPVFQSSQVGSQYLYSRYRNYGLSQSLYGYYPLANLDYDQGLDIDTDPNTYDGVSISGENVPYSGGHYVPFRPAWSGGGSWSTDTNVWNGETNGSGDPDGDGYLNEFSIHKDHPDLLNLGNSYNVNASISIRGQFFGPYDAGSPLQDYLPFSHAPFMETSSNENVGILGNPYFIQANNRIPDTTTEPTRTNDNYPIKLGFKPNDEYLLGKYTCGSYLYLFPNKYEDISVEGNHPALSSKKIDVGSANAINIPFLFQYRCSDKLGYIGGFRSSDTLKNVKYSKKIGIDLFIKDDTPFSFDLDLSVQYKKETTLDSPVVPARGTIDTFFGD